ncbi:PS-10 peptidase S37 [Thermomonospora echinospora]|uniref:PS-10 peptidase S37 n=1 Tax=Thermomonospora echinospora TaxID=1992 RepID=A0A1H6BF65_9ACTN|nr:S28 family serine protease [Thermomonospora echinospora]SEG59005.1 PS-10 peptidase S37 [Thermomonospora echinospora]
MRGWGQRVLAAVTVAGMLGVGTAIPSHAAPAGDIVERLNAIPGMKVLWERPSGAADYRFFLLSYRQPADHRKPGTGTFEQRFTLLHKDTGRPMVLHTTGYNLRETASRSEPTQLLEGNQISVEQRFFTPSRPQPADWSDLTIWQAATDHHRLVKALKPVYSAKWVSTGASKGGMTSIYHRRFYPADVDATVSYVAPNDVVNSEDKAYDRFFEKVGSDPSCRNALKDVQHEVLERRAEFVPRYEAYAKENGFTFGNLGNADRALEATVLDVEWAFWQYSLEADCAQVPSANASTDTLWDFVDSVAGFSFYTDQGLAPYLPYYFQAGTQLGWPEPKFRYLKDVRNYPEIYRPRAFMPADLRAQMRFNPVVMADIDRWVRSHGNRLMFLYGGNDPWGAEPFRLGRGTRDSLWYEVPGLNHSAQLIRALPAGQREQAIAALRRWAGVGDTASVRLKGVSPLDGYDELQVRRPPL